MISIEFSTESGSTYLVDVVSQRFKKIVVKGQPQPTDSIEWYPYKELIGSGKVGECLTFAMEHDSIKTTPVVSLKMV